MKQLINVFISLFVTLHLSAQISFKTGDIELETDLNTINAKAKVNFGEFKVDMAGTYNIDEKKIDYMKVELEMEPAEIYLALEIGRISNRKIDEVLEIYRLNKSKGWGFIAKKMGIKPGSDEFHLLKNRTKNNKSVSQTPNNKKIKDKGNNKGKGKN